MKLFETLLVTTCCLGLLACSPSDTATAEGSQVTAAEGSQVTTAEGSQATSAESMPAKHAIETPDGIELSATLDSHKVVDQSENDGENGAKERQPAVVVGAADQVAVSDHFNSRVEQPQKVEVVDEVSPAASIVEKPKHATMPKIKEVAEKTSVAAPEQLIAASEPVEEVQETVAKVSPPPKPISGYWVKKSQKINGLWTIEHRSDGAYLVLGSDFKTRNAPDLKFVLSGLTAQQVNNKNALQGRKLISPLKSAKGAQEYKLPDDYQSYKTLLLHCEKYTKLWGAADLAAAQ